VLLTALRSPVHLAKSLATLDHLSGGRLDVGVGLGGNPNIYPAYGFTADRRAARFAEGLALMRRLWTEPRVTFEGEFFRLMKEHRVTRYCGAPIVHTALINAEPALREGTTHRVSALVAAAAPPSTMIEGMERIGFDLTHVYGLTETYGPATVCAKHEELIQHCRAHLAHFKAPRAVVFGVVPKTSTGKRRKFVLREQVKSAQAIE
jgi:acyl-coenzyme A synthetase/AMP-(fatty) acid ligase